VEIILGAVGYFGLMAVFGRKMLAEALDSIRLALGRGRFSGAPKGDRSLVEPSTQRESTGTP
jgi:hypothetical protein